MLLIACPECARQYDATGLEVGSQVRCFCERLFLVGWPPKLIAGALTCSHCGGAVSATQEQCPYCQAAISEDDRRKTTLCPGCLTRIDDDSRHCRSCGLAIRPQALSPLPADRDCPRCEGKLRVRSFETVGVVECAACLGMWITPKTFETITTQASRHGKDAATLVQDPRRLIPPNTGEAVRYIPCLVCGELMQRRQYTWRERYSGTVIDVCRGHGLWLDRDEIERIVEFVAMDGSGNLARKPLDPKPFIVSTQNRGPTGERRAGSAPSPWLVDALADIAAKLFSD
jgi:Zn-finger nucleic acid-binding protein